MNIENLIKDTFAARENDAPDSDAVLAAARQRIDSRRSGLSRPFAVAAGANRWREPANRRGRRGQPWLGYVLL